MNTAIPGNLVGSPHRYRITRTASSIQFFVDGTLVATHAAVVGALRPIFSDFEQAAPALSVDWARMTPYSSPCTFTSRVLDSGSNADWRQLTATLDLPAGTTVGFETRSGSSANPDGSWSSWIPLSGGQIQSPDARYLQYRATLASSDDDLTPAVQDVTVSYLLVAPANRAPTAAADGYTVAEDGSLTVAAPGVLANDSDPDGDPLTAGLVDGPANGTLVLNANGGFSYVPNANFHGSDSFTYRASDGSLQSAAATVTITVTPVNDAPVAADDDAGATEEDTSKQISAASLLANDADADGDTLSVSAVTATANTHGTVFLAAGTITYTPAADYHGPAGFEYTLSDGQGGSDTGLVSLTVTPVNDAPVATAQSLATAEDSTLTITLSGGDVDGDALSFRITALPQHGQLYAGEGTGGT